MVRVPSTVFPVGYFYGQEQVQETSAVWTESSPASLKLATEEVEAAAGLTPFPFPMI